MVRMCHLMLWLICECGVLCEAEAVFLSSYGLTSSETYLTSAYLWLSCVHAWEEWDRMCGLNMEGFFIPEVFFLSLSEFNFGRGVEQLEFSSEWL